ncbi:MAG: TRAP transporter small permease [Lachnospiraceae bacterium]|nr:TRAP transporter small permease [Lachnospiraceae bacterium]
MNSKLKDFLDNFEGYCCILTLAAMSIVVFIQVVFRFVVKASLPWSEELSRYLLVWTAFLGGAYGVRQGAHIGVEAFALLLPKKVQKVLAIFIMIASIALCAVIAKYGFAIVQTQLSKGQLSPAMRIPMGYMYAAIPIGMIFFIIRFVQEIILGIKNFNEPEVKEVIE